jgi:anti-sigma B factor antagonist
VHNLPLPVRLHDGCAVVVLPEEIDAVNADMVTDTLLTVLNRTGGSVIADMTGTTFCDAAGIRAIIRAHIRARSLDTGLRVVLASPVVRRIFQLTKVDQLVRVYPAIGMALPKPRRPAGGELASLAVLRR